MNNTKEGYSQKKNNLIRRNKIKYHKNTERYLLNDFIDDYKPQEYYEEIQVETFTEDRLKINTRIKMDSSYIHHPTPKNLKTILLPHQQTVLSAMLELEEKRSIKGFNDMQYKYPWQKSLVYGIKKFNTCAGLLSEKFGSGKTIMILALLVEKPIPNNNPIYQVCRSESLKKIHLPDVSSFFITKKFRQDLILRPALLFVATSVIMQWDKAIKDFTTLKVLIVSSSNNLKELYNCIKRKTINKYDIVLVKNGFFTGEFNIDELIEEKNKKNQRRFYNVIANISRDYCWSRVILDDYDIIKLPSQTAYMNGLFTWFVSATDFNINSRCKDKPEHDDINDILKYHNIDMNYITYTSHLSETMNICNNEKYTEDSVSVGKPVFWAHSINNKNKQYINMIGVMAGDKATEIMEMLNGDAIGTAAECAGIKSDNITDIFKKILQEQYNKYSLSVDTLNWIDTLDIQGFKHLNKPDIDDVYYQKHVYKQRPINYNFPDIEKKVTAVQTECISVKKTSGTAIDRVKCNIKDGDCPVCCGDLKNEDIIIVRCCGKILCADCGVQGSNLRRINKSILGNCPNCRTKIGFNDLIFLEEGFDLNDIIEENNINEKKINNKISTIDDSCVDMSKIDALIKIINGKEIPNKRKIHVVINGMIEGIKDLPEAPPEHRKTIIFSKFDESLNNIQSLMIKYGIKFKRLGGTTSQIHIIATEFQDSYDGINVLLINGEKYASGLNLQSATNLVFMHKIIDKNIESQIIGRIQRLGRVYKAHIHYILYKEEFSYF
jgi:hypothetical protein